MADATHALASLAVEFWKLAANFERQVEHGDDARKAGGHAQLRPYDETCSLKIEHAVLLNDSNAIAFL